MANHFSSLGIYRLQHEKISTADTLPDIKLLVEAKAKSLILKDDKDRATLVKKILAKSEGSFLWTFLVIGDLSGPYGEQELSKALEEILKDMEPLYHRTLESMM